MPGMLTAAGRELMLLLLRANVPSSEVLTANTDREYALIAVKYNIDLPRHLSFLPHMQPPRSRSEKEVIQREHEEQEASMVQEVADKERPPHRTRLPLTGVKAAVAQDGLLNDAASAALPIGGGMGVHDPPPTLSDEQRERLAGQPARSPNADPVDEEYTGKGSAVKERAPTARGRGRRGKRTGKAGKGEGEHPGSTPAAVVAQAPAAASVGAPRGRNKFVSKRLSNLLLSSSKGSPSAAAGPADDDYTGGGGAIKERAPSSRPRRTSKTNAADS